MSIEYRKAAIKGLRRMPRKQALQMKAALNRVSAGHWEGLDIKKLTGVEGWRLRQGSYRAVFEFEQREVRVLVILRIGPRGGVYE